jgi:hypothetical protein
MNASVSPVKCHEMGTPEHPLDMVGSYSHMFLMFINPQPQCFLNLIFPNRMAIKWQRSPTMVMALVAFAQVAGSELRSCSARGASLHMSHAAAGSRRRCGSESEQTWRGGSYV